MSPPPISTSSAPCSESALLRLRLSQERFAELQSDLADFLPASSSSFEDSRGVPLSSSPQSDSQAA
jgi:hypothetical protein